MAHVVSYRNHRLNVHDRRTPSSENVRSYLNEFELKMSRARSQRKMNDISIVCNCYRPRHMHRNTQNDSNSLRHESSKCHGTLTQSSASLLPSSSSSSSSHNNISISIQNKNQVSNNKTHRRQIVRWLLGTFVGINSTSRVAYNNINDWESQASILEALKERKKESNKLVTGPNMS